MHKIVQSKNPGYLAKPTKSSSDFVVQPLRGKFCLPAYRQASKIWDNKEIRGITLVEIMFSVAILSLVIISILVTFIQTVDISKRINYEYAATNLAKKRLEDAKSIIKTNGFDALIRMEEAEEAINAEGEPDSEGEFTRKTHVSSDGGNALLTKVEVEIKYYYLGKKKTSPVAMATVFTKLE